MGDANRSLLAQSTTASVTALLFLLAALPPGAHADPSQHRLKPLEGRRILVTGATGFVGQHLIANLVSSGASVRVAVHQTPWAHHPQEQVAEVSVDVREPREVAAAVAGMDAVVHLAAVAHDRRAGREAQQSVTLKGTRNVAGAAVESGVESFVFVSSVAVYGPTGPTVYSEESDCRPDSAYGEAKLAAEKEIAARTPDAATTAFILRPPLIYGANVKGNLARMIGAMRAGLFPPLPDTGARRSMLHVKNLCTAVIQLLSKDVAAGTFNLTDRHDYSTAALHEAIRKALGMPPTTWRVPVGLLRAAAYAGDAVERCTPLRSPLDSRSLSALIGSSRFSSQKAQDSFGYDPQFELEDALADLVMPP